MMSELDVSQTPQTRQLLTQIWPLYCTKIMHQMFYPNSWHVFRTQVQIKLSARFPGKKPKNVLQYKFKSRTNSACINTNEFHKAFFSFMRNLIQSHICRHSEVVQCFVQCFWKLQYSKITLSVPDLIFSENASQILSCVYHRLTRQLGLDNSIVITHSQCIVCFFPCLSCDKCGIGFPYSQHV